MSGEGVRRRLDSLTKPPGSLGRLEDLLIDYARITGKEPPREPRAAALVFCGDHGIVQEGVSKWPQAVTRLMAQNMVAGGAAINVLCRHHDVDLQVIDVGIAGDPVPGVRSMRIASGTRNFAKQAAMTREQADRALATGRSLALESTADVLLCGEMGIGNTTAATALLCAVAGCQPEEVTGPGAGLDAEGVRRKAAVIGFALEAHPSRELPEIAATFGGLEILAIAGVIAGAAEKRVPVLLDGFISTSAALIARRRDTVWYSHCSAEPGHRRMLDHLAARPLLELDLRLGEGTGAVMAYGLFQAACAIYHEMATFDSAGI